MHAGRRTVAVIRPSEARNLHVHTPQQAKQVLHATHSRQTTVHREGNDLVTQVSVVDLETQVHLCDFFGRYSAVIAAVIPEAIAGDISFALRLQGGKLPETLSPDARQLYDQALIALQRDENSYEQALPLFERAKRLDERSPLPWAGLAEAQIRKYNATKQPSVLDEARHSVLAAENLNPDSARVRLVAGLLRSATGENEQALQDFQRVQELEPRNTDAFLRMAKIYEDLHETDKAIENYRKAIVLDPGSYRPYHRIGVLYYYLGRYTEAAEQFQKSIDRAPRFEEYSNLGATLDELGRDAEAERALLKSLQIQENADALNNMGAMRAYQKKDEEALGYYLRSVAMDPSDYVSVENIGDSYRRLGRLRKARKA